MPAVRHKGARAAAHLRGVDGRAVALTQSALQSARDPHEAGSRRKADGANSGPGDVALRAVPAHRAHLTQYQSCGVPSIHATAAALQAYVPVVRRGRIQLGSKTRAGNQGGGAGEGNRTLV